MVTTFAYDLADPGFWRLPEGERLAAFRELRALGVPRKFGDFWALTRHAHVVEASRRGDVFLSGTGVTTPRPPRWVRAVFGDSMVNLDDPRHSRLRGVVSKAFTPRVVSRIAGDVTDLAARIAEDVRERRPGDFVEAVAGRLPFAVICDMMGIPESYRPEVRAQVDHTTERTGGRLRVPGKNLRALARLHLVVAEVARQRRREPADDLISALAGAGLNARELGSFFSLLLVAGVETTRNTIAHGLRLLTEHPDQRALLLADFAGHGAGFVEEVVRHSSPIIQFRRTLARDHSFEGTVVKAGEDVMLFYSSANRDEAVFGDPDAFDVTRSPNPHVGFGGGGPHFCLGTSLARQEITAIFRELLARMPAIRATGAAEMAPSSFDNRIARLPFTF
ncbi:cytochrome P450 [Actinoplanes sp. NPDC049265]|uniref:cytochrome P450 n=1 Tax=Actinoplanes sp. NPDC049265 TaxID=3363902 RepID=UPI00371658CB